MIITENFFEIEDKVEQFSKLLAKHSVAQEYLEALKIFKTDSVRSDLEKILLRKYEAFLQVREYPEALDYQEKLREFYRTKQEYDLLETVADLRLKQNNLQMFLDKIAKSIARRVNPDILVESSVSFSVKKCKGCGLHE